jgi:putative glycosyltransferase (TIGR04348 family)
VHYHPGVLRILIITPHTNAEGSGNATTAQRWAKRLRELNCRVQVATRYDGSSCDMLVALHARKSAGAIQRFSELYPRRPLIVALTGTDVYDDLSRSARARESIQLATRLIVLQRLALDELAARHRRKAVVIEQSVPAPSSRERAAQRRARAAAYGRQAGRRASFRGLEIAVLANLRHVKDPLRAAMAVRRLPHGSRIHVVHAGTAMTADYRRRAQRESLLNARYTWAGPLSAAHTRRLLLRSQALVLSSRLEGGANVVSEAIVYGVPVLASDIPGSVGLLGRRYPGYFRVGDSAGLAALLRRLETEPRFAARLRRHVRALAPRFTPARERAAWRRLLRGLHQLRHRDARGS